MFFAKSIGRFIGKNISGKYSQKLFGHAKQSATNTLKAASWEAIEKTAEATGDLFGKKLLMKSQKSENLHHRIIQKQLKVK